MEVNLPERCITEGGRSTFPNNRFRRAEPECCLVVANQRVRERNVEGGNPLHAIKVSQQSRVSPMCHQLCASERCRNVIPLGRQLLPALKGNRMHELDEPRDLSHV